MDQIKFQNASITSHHLPHLSSKEHLRHIQQLPRAARHTRHATHSRQRTLIAGPLERHTASAATMAATPKRGKSTLDAVWQADTERAQQRGQRAAGDQRENDQHEDFEGVVLQVVEEVAQQVAQLAVHAGEEAFAGGALVVGGGAAHYKEGVSLD